jgi:gluconolactonase
MYPLLEHQSVLRMEETRGGWTLERMTFDTVGPRALALSADEKTLFVADAREIRAYPVKDDGKLGPHRLLHAFGGDHRGIEGLCLDAEGNLIACGGWKKSGPGPLIYVFTPAGRILRTDELPCDLPMRVAFGDAHRSTLYLTTGEGMLYRATSGGHAGASMSPA